MSMKNHKLAWWNLNQQEKEKRFQMILILDAVAVLFAFWRLDFFHALFIIGLIGLITYSGYSDLKKSEDKKTQF